MSQKSPSTITRRSVLAGSAAGLASAAMLPAFAGTSFAASAAPVATLSGSHRLCAAHHAELANHLKGILNSAYVDEQMKNKVLSTSHCPHCDVAIAPDQMNQASFAAL